MDTYDKIIWCGMVLLMVVFGWSVVEFTHTYYKSMLIDSIMVSGFGYLILSEARRLAVQYEREDREMKV